MAEDPRFLLHFKTLNKFNSKLSDNTINANRHMVFIKDKGRIWCRGTLYSDMEKLNGIEENANNYTLPSATSTKLGGIKVGSGLTITDGVLSVSSSSSSDYELPIASTVKLGGIKIGYNVSFNSDEGEFGLKLKDTTNYAYIKLPFASTVTNGLLTTDDYKRFYNSSTKVDTIETKLDEITSTGGEPNVIESVQINGASLDITKKTVNIPLASSTTAGVIKVGSGLSINSSGVLSATGGGTADSVDWSNITNKPTIPSEYSLPTASKTVLGGVKVGDGLSINNGVLSVTNTSSGSSDYTLPTANSTTLGGIKIGYTSTANNRALQLDNSKAYINVPDATTSQSGLMTKDDKTKLTNLESSVSTLQTKIDGLTTNGGGEVNVIETIKMYAATTDPWALEVTNKSVTIPPASATTFGVVKTGFETVDNSFAVKTANGGNLYTNVPKATSTTYGVVKLGNGLKEDSSGIVNVDVDYINSSATISAPIEKINIFSATAGAVGLEIIDKAVTIPAANSTTFGLVRTGFTTIDNSFAVHTSNGGQLYTNVTKATANDFGVVKVGDGLKVTDGLLKVDSSFINNNSGSNYTLPTASSSTLGGIKVGNGLEIDDKGVLTPNIKILVLTQSQYDALITKDKNTLYCIPE